MSGRCRMCHFRPCRCEDLSQGYSKAQASKGRWPIYSDAAGVLPRQIPDALEEAKRKGVPISFAKDGRAIFESQAHQRRYLRAIGLNNRADYFA